MSRRTSLNGTQATSQSRSARKLTKMQQVHIQNGKTNGFINDKMDNWGDKYDLMRHWKPLPFKKLPEWLQDNEYLLDGHRPALPDFRICFESIFRIHVETGNIWTHLLGCLLFIGIAIYFTWQPMTQDFQVQDKIVFGFFYLGAVICLGFSFIFHTLCCHSPQISFLFSKLDYSGILLLSSLSSTPLIYYCFYCRPEVQIRYLLGLGISGVLTMYFSMSEHFSSTKWRPVRTAVFITFGALSVLPGYHFGLVEGWSNSIVPTSVGSLTLMSLLYLTGALMYGFRIPERFYPGKFDIVLHSHQFLHILVVAAALVHFYGISQLAIYQLANIKC